MTITMLATLSVFYPALLGSAQRVSVREPCASMSRRNDY